MTSQKIRSRRVQEGKIHTADGLRPETDFEAKEERAGGVSLFILLFCVP